MNSGDAFLPCKQDVADAVADIGKRQSRGFGQSCARRRVPSVSGKTKPERCKRLKQGFTGSIAAALGDIDGELDQIAPQRAGSRNIVSVQHVRSAFACQFF